MKKKNSKLSGFYLGLIFVLMYLPIAVVIVFSFNESKLPVRFTGFSLKWYQELIHDDANDRGTWKQPLSGCGELPGICCDRHPGCSRTFQDPLEDKRDSGIYFYFTADDP